MSELIKMGFVKPRDGDMVQATEAGTSSVQLAQYYECPVPISKYMSSPPPAEQDMTTMDLLVSLLADGWGQRALTNKSKQESYKVGGERVILYQPSQPNLGKAYLLALWKSCSIFAKGVSEIYHGQLEGYYHALLESNAEQARRIRPNLKLKDYKALVSSQSLATDFQGTLKTLAQIVKVLSSEWVGAG